MSCDIYLYDKFGNEFLSMNWFRNPFGLLNWIKENTSVDMYDVVNDPANKNLAVDRELFLRQARQAYAEVAVLEKAFFKIPVDWVEKAHSSSFLHREYYIPWVAFERRNDEFGWVDVEVFGGLAREGFFGFGVTCGKILRYYKDWTAELYRFALALQDEALEYYCSN